MKDKLILKGHVLYAEKTMYKWVADFGENTCKTCAAMDGKMFEKDEVPYWPHPNCRCRVEEVSVIDVLESEMHDYKEELEQLSLQANELLGDSNVLEERVNKLEKEFDDEEVKKLSNDLNHQQCEIFGLIDYIEALNIDTVSATIIESIQQKIEEIYRIIKEYMNEYQNLSIKLKLEKYLVDTSVFLGQKIGKDAAALWELSSSKFTRGLDYIKNNNGKIIDNVSDLNDKKLEETVRKKLHDQIKRKEARGIWLPENSTLSKSIANSLKFKEVIKKNEEKLCNGEIIEKDSTYLNSNPNIFLSINGCDILNIRIENNILYATILDTVDYNKNDPLVVLPRDLQKGGTIENYYILIEIAEPIEKYFKK